MTDALSYRRRRLEPPSQRLRRAWLRLSGSAAKSQRVYRVDVDGIALKQILLPDGSAAAELAGLLTRFRDARIAPRLVAHYGRELWLEFLEGEVLSVGEPAPEAELARIFSALYRADPRPVPRGERDFGAELAGDLDFLCTTGVLGARDHAALVEHASAWTPDPAWVGIDYTDPRPANLLRVADGGLRIIDVESFHVERLLGVGSVRATLRWPDLSRERLVARLAASGAAPFAADLDFVELWFLASWSKRCVLQRKRHLLDRERLAALAARG